MKLIILLMTVALLQVHAKGVSQSVTFSGENIPVKQVFSVITEQTGYDIFGKLSLLDKARPVSINATDMPLADFMKIVTKGQPFSYQITEKTIILSEKVELEKPTIIQELEEAPPVTGVVRGPDGQSLGGVNIIVKGTKKGTTSKLDGQFSIEAKEGDILIFTSIGYTQKEFKVGSYQQVGNISMLFSESKLDEIQIIAYGRTTQRLSTGNITTIKADEIEKQPVANPLLALQGRVPGLQITQASGVPGSGVSVLIQGQNSLANGNDPFYVIDGVPYPAQLLPNEGYILGNSRSGRSSPTQNGNPLSFLNPLDIESIDVLKDASATAIYGSRAANGAILITTKKGKAGKTKLDLNFQNGWSRNVRRLPLMNTQQYLEVRREGLKNDGIEPSIYDFDLNGLWDTASNKDWQKILTGKTAHYNDFQVSVSGGNNGTSFLVSGNYHRETNVFPGDFADQKGSFHYNVNHLSPDHRFSLQLIGSYQHDDNRLPQIDVTGLSISMPPNAPDMYNPDGTINWALAPEGYSSWQNPVVQTMYRYKNQTNNLINSITAGYEILEGWDFKTSFHYNRLESAEFSANPGTAVDPYNIALYGVNPWRRARFGNNFTTTWSLEPQTSYKKRVGKGRLEILLGATITNTQANGRLVSASNFISDDLLEDMASASVISGPSTTNFQYKYFGVFSRINYNWQDKYLVDLTARRDGSSRFGAENRFHNFGAIGAAWIFSSESFIHEILPFLSFGKLRASYGTTGNDQIGDYQFMDLYSSVSVTNNNRYQNTTGFIPVGLSNPYLQWEETRKLQGAIDLGFLKDRILLKSGFYINRCSNQLLGYLLPATTGFGTITSNLNATQQNTGWEFVLTSENIKSANFNWTTALTLTVPRDKIISFENFETSSYRYLYTLGKSINYTKVLRFGGVDPLTGNYQFFDKDGKLTSSPNYNEDATGRIYQGQQFYGGFSNSFRYKGFQLDLFFSFAKQQGQSTYFGSFPGAVYNNDVRLLQRWQKPGDEAIFQQYSANLLNFEQLVNASGSDASWEDASYIRLNNLSLSWQMPNSWVENVLIKNFRLFIQGRNLLTITNFSGLDPETRGGTGLPPLQVLTLGAQVNL